MEWKGVIPALTTQRAEAEIPEELERIILACLEKDPAARPQSAEEHTGSTSPYSERYHILNGVSGDGTTERTESSSELSASTETTASMSLTRRTG